MTSTKPVPATQQPKPAPAAAATAAPAAKGKRKPTDAEREARKAALAAEPSDVKFRRIVRPRLAKAINAMRQIENVGKGTAYEYSPEQAGKVLQHLTDAVTRVKVAFSPKVRGARAVQELPDL